MMMLKGDPDAEAKYLESETGIPTVAARDGMQISLSEEIEIVGTAKKDGTRTISA